MNQLSATLTDAVPRHRAGASIRQDGAHAVLVERSGEHLHRLNPTALAIWELCDGETTVPEMIAAASELFAAAAVEQLKNDVVGVLQQLTSAGLVDWVTPSEACELEIVTSLGLDDETNLV
jgi:pyrroloquinoline quinone biosynthesis protein D